MNNIVYDLLVIKFFNIQTREGRMVLFIDIIWKVSSTNWFQGEY